MTVFSLAVKDTCINMVYLMLSIHLNISYGTYVVSSSKLCGKKYGSRYNCLLACMPAISLLAHGFLMEIPWPVGNY